jgi:hypothetical protein
MRKKAPYGGLSERNAELIRTYLEDVNPIVPDGYSYNGGGRSLGPFSMWNSLLNGSRSNLSGLAHLGQTDQPTAKAFRAAFHILKKKRKGRIWDMNPVASFEALGIFRRQTPGAWIYPPGYGPGLATAPLPTDPTVA